MCLKSGHEEWTAAAGETACGGRHKAMAFGDALRRITRSWASHRGGTSSGCWPRTCAGAAGPETGRCAEGKRVPRGRWRAMAGWQRMVSRLASDRLRRKQRVDDGSFRCLFDICAIFISGDSTDAGGGFFCFGGLCGVISQRGYLSAAARHVGIQSPAFLLSGVQVPDSGVA